MGKNSGVEWTDHSFNGWWGCRRVLVRNPETGKDEVDPACLHCYADRDAKRYGFPTLWGGDHRFFLLAHWNALLRWDATAISDFGRPARVFAFSFGDIFEEHPDLVERREQLYGYVPRTPNLRYLFLTKRIENVETMVPKGWLSDWPANVYLGTSISNQTTADLRLPILFSLPAPIRFVSYEPAFGLVSWRDWLGGWQPADKLDWIIAGGESGAKARPSHPDYFRHARDAAAEAGVPFFFKQWGEWLSFDKNYPGIEYSGAPGETQAVNVDGRRISRIEWSPTGDVLFARVGKKKAGALLDGREWKEFPEFAS